MIKDYAVGIDIGGTNTKFVRMHMIMQKILLKIYMITLHCLLPSMAAPTSLKALV